MNTETKAIKKMKSDLVKAIKEYKEWVSETEKEIYSKQSFMATTKKLIKTAEKQLAEFS